MHYFVVHRAQRDRRVDAPALSFYEKAHTVNFTILLVDELFKCTHTSICLSPGGEGLNQLHIGNITETSTGSLPLGHPQMSATGLE